MFGIDINIDSIINKGRLTEEGVKLLFKGLSDLQQDMRKCKELSRETGNKLDVFMARCNVIFEEFESRQRSIGRHIIGLWIVVVALLMATVTL